MVRCQLPSKVTATWILSAQLYNGLLTTDYGLLTTDEYRLTTDSALTASEQRFQRVCPRNPAICVLFTLTHNVSIRTETDAAASAFKKVSPFQTAPKFAG